MIGTIIYRRGYSNYSASFYCPPPTVQMDIESNFVEGNDGEQNISNGNHSNAATTFVCSKDTAEELKYNGRERMQMKRHSERVNYIQAACRSSPTAFVIFPLAATDGNQFQFHLMNISIIHCINNDTQPVIIIRLNIEL